VIRIVAPAKVNLFLGIGAVRADGYHDLVSVFHALDLADELTIADADTLSVTCEPPLDVPAHDNLAYRAAVRLGELVGHDPRVALTIRKSIPHGAGLGGGSSDAAATIAGLAHLWGLERRDPRCLQAAAETGADVAFFLVEGGAALMAGRGEVLVAEIDALAGVSVVLVRPAEPVSTAAAYIAFDADPTPAGDPAALVEALHAGDPVALAASLENNLEHVAARIVPAVGEVLGWVRAQAGVLGAHVAGSGSAVFGITQDHEAAERIAEQAAECGWWGCATRLRARGVEVVEGAQ
jgi:4-diphosphocytidyl-2-C-methyl-D-erythritol kinase